ncbi:hypothetical protein ABZ468_07900 [Streptomyces sp. NPDC005708]|uniref:DUF7210 family protein n=1 Tax=Streptomyces sp. NPDC005708 TaxID=3154564 RepID=UPI0033D62161
MTTTTKKSTSAAAEAAAEVVTAEAQPAVQPKATPTTVAPAVVGPVPAAGVEPVTVTLSHHLAINGKDYQPGSVIRVSPDYARRLRTQGYTART